MSAPRTPEALPELGSTCLSDGWILLRPWRTDDADALLEAVLESRADVYPWLPWCHPKYTRLDAEEWIASCPGAWTEDTGYQFAVVDAADGRLLGGCGLDQVNRVNSWANLGYWCRTSAAGRGVTTAATRMLARFGLEWLGLGRIEILAALGNLASQRVAEKAGAVREGSLRQRLVLHGIAHDTAVYSLTPAELPILRAEG